MRFLLLILLLISAEISQAQSIQSQLRFELLFNGVKLNINELYFDPIHEDSIKITTLKFYVSDIVLNFKRENAPPAYYPVRKLIDFKYPESLEIADIDVSGIKSLSFILGLDSSINVSGALGGDLDPTQGMYWSWQSGYINFKIEGISKNCLTRDKSFIFHLGGYKKPFESIRKVNLDFKSEKSNIIQLDLIHFFKKTDLSRQSGIMSPSRIAKDKSRILAESFNSH
mgnify:CR=1 FL=1|tara:strand:+ start:672 stop:1352 length:681 start_codon:yes stop_codon:yes gene_type:complete